uniref:Uncharacterized protein n=1 Tax=Leersia perrieri TaxID=77586 RepID=A0A0D9XR89_9ORYZ
MALVVICGQPCSGKSAAAACLTAALSSSATELTVRTIDESSLHLGRNDSYKGTTLLCNIVTFYDGIVESSSVIAEAVSYLTKKVDSKTRDVKVLQPTIATQMARTTESNSLYEMDKATQRHSNASCLLSSFGF